MEDDEYAFVNNFWGIHSAQGFETLTGRDRTAQRTLDDLRVIYRERAAIEEDYSKKLAKLARVSLGKDESGTAREALEVVKAELVAVSQGHLELAGMMRSQLEGAIAAFIGRTRDGRREAYLRIERLHKTKVAQEGFLGKAREKYEMEYNKATGYNHGHQAYGSDGDRMRTKIERAQSAVQSAEREYQNCFRALEETTRRWSEEWRAFCDDFQDFEEERLTFLKANLWDYANVVSTLCVADDESCERIRVSLEACDVDQNVMHFVKNFGSGAQIPDPPLYLNANVPSDRRPQPGYSVAQFPRQSNRQQIRRRRSQASLHASAHKSKGSVVEQTTPRKSAENSPASQTTPSRARQQVADPRYEGSNSSHDLQYNSRTPPQPKSSNDHFSPMDPRADVRLNVGQNMLPVDASTLRDKSQGGAASSEPNADPIAAALADLRRKGSQRSLASRKSFNRGSSHIDQSLLDDSTPSKPSNQHNSSQAVSSGMTGPANLGVSPQKGQDRPVSRNSFRSAISSNSRQADNKFGVNSTGTSPSRMEGKNATPLGIRLDASGNVMQDDLADEYMERVRRQNGNGPPRSTNTAGKGQYTDQAMGRSPQAKQGGYSPQVNGYRDPNERAQTRSPSPLPPQAPIHQGTGEVLNGRNILFYVKALYDYDATIEEEFSFRAGDVIGVTETEEDGWWQGELVGTRSRVGGTFPSNFTEHVN